MKTKNIVKYNLILFCIFLLAYIFNDNFVNIYANFNISIGIVIYSFSYVVCTIMIEKYKISECKNIIANTIKMFFVFYLIATIACNINSPSVIHDSLINIFTPREFYFNDYLFHIPNILSLVIYPAIVYLSHNIFFVVYEVVEDYTSYSLSFIIAILISFILDQMIYTTAVNYISIINDVVSVEEFITLLTSNFIVTLLSTVLLLPFTLLFTKKVSD